MALNYMHKENVIHRDLKMENVLIDIDEDIFGKKEIICKLTDFGLSCVQESGKNVCTKVGTPYFMAPELMKGQNYDSKVDTWALGAITYILLSGGEFPFKGRDFA